jgi:hypothetical protein
LEDAFSDRSAVKMTPYIFASVCTWFGWLSAVSLLCFVMVLAGKFDQRCSNGQFCFGAECETRKGRKIKKGRRIRCKQNGLYCCRCGSLVCSFCKQGVICCVHDVDVHVLVFMIIFKCRRALHVWV